MLDEQSLAAAAVPAPDLPVEDPTQDPAVYFDDEYPPEVSEEEAIEAAKAGARSVRQAPPDAPVNLNVPFIHQLWDTANEFDGHWACGATSSAMVLAYYGFLPPRPLTISVPQPHQNDYGWYVSNAFEHQGTRFELTSGTPNGRAAGIYGLALDDVPGLGWVSVWLTARKGIKRVMDAFMPGVGNETRFEGAMTQAKVKASLDAGHPVIVAGTVFGNRHIIVFRGYYCDENGDCHFIVNDPFSYRTTGKTHDGGGVVYEWSEIRPRWGVMFSGPHLGPPPAPPEPPAPPDGG